MTKDAATLTLNAIDELSNGFRYSQILFAGVRLGIFDALAERPHTAEELAGRLCCDLRGTRILCDALTAIEVLRREGGRYVHTPEGGKLLASGGPSSFANMLRHKAALYERWGKLCDAVKSGKPADDSVVDPRLALTKEVFARSMADGGRMIAQETAETLDFSGVKRVLDVGGGPGVYAVAFARRHPELRVTILDDAETLAVAREYTAGAADRIALRAGDIMRDEISERFDLVFVSNVAHMFSPAENMELARRAAGLLSPGGRVCIKDFLLDEGRVSPPRAAVFAVNMLVNTAAGDCYTIPEAQAWLRAAGLLVQRVIELSPPNRMVVGRAP